jgi:glycosyltransferase involved in cell wall biosynthesis
VRVAVDTSPLVQTRAGTARYLAGLLRELERHDDVEIRRLAFGGAGRAAAFVRDTFWYPARLPRAARGADILHCPTYRGPARSATPLVVTVHDLAIFRHPGVFNRWSRLYGRRMIPRVVRAARRVIAVSEFTRRELVELLRIPEQRIRVIPNAVDETFSAEGPAAEGEYVLAVGTIEPRKNLPRLASAARSLGVELRVVGSPGWGGVEVDDEGVRWLGWVPDDELARLYRGARCVAYASVYEGFGIPVLEAMACGAPVVTSRGGATEEVADGAAVLVDPLDPAEIAGGIERAVSEHADLKRRGLERASRFTWAVVADATVAVYREAAG